jgi:hypothetical protein
MVWFLDCDIEGLTVQQIINEATDGIPCIKAPLPDG